MAEHEQVTEVRALRPDDWKVWRDLRLAALETDAQAFRAPVADVRAMREDESHWRERLQLVGSHNLAAFRNGEPAGMVSAVLEEADRVHLFSMWVVPDLRGTGLADLLVGDALRWARATGAREVTLDVDEDNARAQAVYTRHGFGRGGTSPHSNCVRMRLVLGDSADG
jgi:ribosomal protein S18 acetylase RimI-like enzyme